MRPPSLTMNRFRLTRVRRSIQLHLRSHRPGSHAVQCAVRSCGVRGISAAQHDVSGILNSRMAANEALNSAKEAALFLSQAKGCAGPHDETARAHYTHIIAPPPPGTARLGSERGSAGCSQDDRTSFRPLSRRPVLWLQDAAAIACASIVLGYLDVVSWPLAARSCGGEA
jgi:hypothetical protein